MRGMSLEPPPRFPSGLVHCAYYISGVMTIRGPYHIKHPNDQMLGITRNINSTPCEERDVWARLSGNEIIEWELLRMGRPTDEMTI